MLVEIEATKEFEEWVSSLPAKYEAQIRKRLLAIQIEGHFGDCKSLKEGLFELRWKGGRRIYFARIEDRVILLLLGGLKNEQDKQIKKARLMLKRYAD
ncbi:MAG: hypothetical protein S4CHLAM2_08270 [Chlamydiales bacterium]|nr:hypothetical protein [Chlamydiales bacterium]